MSDESVDGLVTLTERTVNLVNQLNMPLVEVSLVIQKHLSQLMHTLQQHLDATGQTVGERVHSPCLLYTSPSPRDRQKSRMPSSA